jgi:hypothetical protein
VGNVGVKTMSMGLYFENNNRIAIIIQRYTEWNTKKDKIGEKKCEKKTLTTFRIQSKTIE